MLYYVVHCYKGKSFLLISPDHKKELQKLMVLSVFLKNQPYCCCLTEDGVIKTDQYELWIPRGVQDSSAPLNAIKKWKLD